MGRLYLHLPWKINQNVGKYLPYMDPMGFGIIEYEWNFLKFLELPSTMGWTGLDWCGMNFGGLSSQLSQKVILGSYDARGD